MPKRDGGVLPIGADVSPSTDPTDVRDVPVSDVMSPIVVVLAASASARDAAS